MSINITDKVGDNVETLVENTNEAITTVNNQLDTSVLANLTTNSKDTLVNAINELNMNKLDANATKILNDFSVNGSLEANSIIVNTDEDGNSSVYFYDTTESVYIKLFWNNSTQKWQLSFPNGDIVDIVDSNNLADIQYQIDHIVDNLEYNFNISANNLILKQLSTIELNGYAGPAGEIVINSDNYREIRIQDGTTIGGNSISVNLTIDNWKPEIYIPKDQIVFYNDGIYRAKEGHTSGTEFDVSQYDILAAYRKYVEHLVIDEETDTIAITQSANGVDNLDINIGGLVVQKTNYVLLDQYHVKFNDVLPVGTEVEVTHYSGSTNFGHSGTVGVVKYTALEDGETTIALGLEIPNALTIVQVNVENTSLLNTEWTLGNDNTAVVLKNPLKEGDRVQITYLKVDSIGLNGVTFTPTISNNVLSWTNDGGLNNPDPITIVTANTTQTVNASKTFTNLKVTTREAGDNSEFAASTEYVDRAIAEGGGSGGSASFPLFTYQWTDHKLENASWLRADTFSWQSGDIYVAAYNELLNEYNNENSVEETDGDITYKRTPKGYKIVAVGQEIAIVNLYNDTGVAWYYIIDTENNRFKLPRTKYNFTGLRSGVGNYVEESLPNITGTWDQNLMKEYGGTVGTGALKALASGRAVNSATGGGSNAGGIELDASLSSSAYQDGAPVQQRATEAYLYFFVGNTIQKTTEIETGKVMELVNDYELIGLQENIDEIIQETIETLDSAAEGWKNATHGNIGDIKYTLRQGSCPYGGVWADGSTYTKEAYPGIYQMLIDGKLLKITTEEYSEQISDNGVCGFFGLDTENETFRVPTLKNLYLKAGDANLGEFGAESLPNIKYSNSGLTSDPIIDGPLVAGTKWNAMQNETASSTRYIQYYGFDASIVSDAYQDDAKVNPDHICYRAYVIVYNAVEETTEATFKAWLPKIEYWDE